MPPIKQLKDNIIAHCPITYLLSWEENRVEQTIKNILTELYPEINFCTWTVSEGLKKEGNSIPETSTPIQALNYIIQSKEAAGFLMKDLHPFVKNDPQVVRRLRDVYYSLKDSNKFLFLLSPFLYLPQELKKEVEVVNFGLPGLNELEKLLDEILSSSVQKKIRINLTEEEKKDLVIAVQGLTFDEARRAYFKAFHGREMIDSSLLETLHLEKKQLILKEGVLEFVPQKWGMNDIGGLDILKDWLKKREKAFTPEAQKFGLTPPKGLLIMGVSGCGKSISIKAISTLWNLPLFRLDMNLVYSGIAGLPEEAFTRALNTIDSVAPAILWIDEIESGINYKQSEGAASRIFGYFLTWMQEHDSQVFIGATANRIDLLPAELLRRGRFDQIFFIDLPTEKEREEIFKIHLLKRNNDLTKFDLNQLAKIAKGWSGTEIEQAIISAMYEAFNEGRPLNEDDLFKVFSRTVPLSTTMAEQIKRIKSWAHGRAVRASSQAEL
ncbi:MAG: AAA family ATPase [Candidatus Aminicenantia bacterium]